MLALGITAIFLLRSTANLEVILSDGNTFALERLRYEPLSGRRTPRGIEFLRTVISGLTGQPNFRRYAEPGSMVLWFSLREKESGKLIKPDFVRVVALDEHGCEFHASDFQLHGPSWSLGGYPAGSPPTGGPWKYILVSGLLRSFPTRQEEFPLHVYDGKGDRIAEYRIPNPAPKRSVVWTAQSLPATNVAAGGIAVVLESVTNSWSITDRHGAMWERTLVVPTAKALQNGEVTPHWKLQSTYLSDATGQSVNAEAASLCVREAAWKVELEFERKPSANFGTNESWTLTGQTIPAPGKVVSVGKSNLMEGVTFELLAIAGAASVTYSNGVPLSAGVSSLGSGGSSVSTSSGLVGGKPSVQVKVDSGKPHVVLLVHNWKDEMRLSLRARDDTGKETLAPWPSMTAGGPGVDLRMFQLDTATNAKAIDLTFIAHRSRRFEFLIAPPPPPAPRPQEWSEDARRQSAGQIPPRPAGATPALIDLTTFYTRALSNRYVQASGSVKNGSWSRSYNFSSLPVGITRFGDVDFDVRGAVQLSGLALQKSGEQFPKQVTAIPVRRLCKRIHFLHGTIWSMEEASEIGQFVIHFENGEKSVLPIRYGIEVRDWDLFGNEAPTVKRADLILVPKTSQGSAESGCLYKTTFENPKPDLRVEAIDFTSRNSASGPFLIAITVE